MSEIYTLIFRVRKIREWTFVMAITALLAPATAASDFPFPPTKRLMRPSIDFAKRRLVTVLTDNQVADLQAVAGALRPTRCRFVGVLGGSRREDEACEAAWICPGAKAGSAIDLASNVVSVSDDVERPLERTERYPNAVVDVERFIKRLDAAVAALGSERRYRGSCAFATVSRDAYKSLARGMRESDEAVQISFSFNIHRATREVLDRAHQACSQAAPYAAPDAAPASGESEFAACGGSWPVGFWDALLDDDAACEMASEWTMHFIRSAEVPHDRLGSLMRTADAWPLMRCRALSRDKLPKDCKEAVGEVNLSVPVGRLVEFERSLAGLGRSSRLGAAETNHSPAAILTREREALGALGDARVIAELVDASLRRVVVPAAERVPVKIIWCRDSAVDAQQPARKVEIPAFMNTTR